MALGNTSDRYNYIYGNTVRKLTSPLPEPDYRNPARRPRNKGSYPAGKTILDSPAEPARQARELRKAEHALDFDWKYTVILTLAIFVFMAAAIFYIKGTVSVHNLNSQITELKEEKTRLLGKQTALKSEIDKAANLDEIRTYAVRELKMVYPDKEHTINYTDDYDDYIRQYESVDAHQ